MSGGGLWQVPIYKTEQGVWRHKTPWLSGVVFYQEETQANRGAVKCHGRHSVYKVAYDAQWSMSSRDLAVGIQLNLLRPERSGARRLMARLNMALARAYFCFLGR